MAFTGKLTLVAEYAEMQVQMLERPLCLYQFSTRKEAVQFMRTVKQAWLQKGFIAYGSVYDTVYFKYAGQTEPSSALRLVTNESEIAALQALENIEYMTP